MPEAKPYVLIVEDEPATADILRFNLENRGYECDCAYDGDEAVRMATTRSPNLMILDINMPGMSGWEVLDLLPLDGELSAIPVIILSGRDTQRDIRTGWTYEIVTYFTKPFDMGELMEFVERLMKVKDEGNGQP
jgi:DNA-binding response OmpR family regulator